MDLLCDRRWETAKSLAALFGIAARTIRNDITALFCTYPIQTIRGRYGGIQVVSWYHSYRQELAPQQEILKASYLREAQAEVIRRGKASLLSLVRPTKGQVEKDDIPMQNSGATNLLIEITVRSSRSFLKKAYPNTRSLLKSEMPCRRSKGIPLRANLIF